LLRIAGSLGSLNRIAGSLAYAQAREGEPARTNNNFICKITGKQLASYAGVAPFGNSSGTSIKGRIKCIIWPIRN